MQFVLTITNRGYWLAFVFHAILSSFLKKKFYSIKLKYPEYIQTLAILIKKSLAKEKKKSTDLYFIDT